MKEEERKREEERRSSRRGDTKHAFPHFADRGLVSRAVSLAHPTPIAFPQLHSLPLLLGSRTAATSNRTNQLPPPIPMHLWAWPDHSRDHYDTQSCSYTMLKRHVLFGELTFSSLSPALRPQSAQHRQIAMRRLCNNNDNNLLIVGP